MENEETNKQTVSETSSPSAVDEIVVTAKKPNPLLQKTSRIVTAPIRDAAQGLKDVSELPGHIYKVGKAIAKGDMTGAFIAAGDVADDVVGIGSGAAAISNPLSSIGRQALGEGGQFAQDALQKKSPEITPATEPVTSIAVIEAQRPTTLTMDPTIQAQLNTMNLVKFDVAEANPAQAVAPSTSQGAEIRLAQTEGLSGR